MLISKEGRITPELVVKAAELYSTPLYLYDESIILDRCRRVLEMPNAFGLKVRYAIKANSNKALLQLITAQGLHLDLSSLNEGKRAFMAGVPYDRMMLTTQEVPLGEERRDLEKMILAGMKYNVCSLRQLKLVADFAHENNIALSMRVHPGTGAGESATRNTGHDYSSFGVHLTDIDQALDFARKKGLVFDQIHVHIGSGGDPAEWRENIDRELGFVEKYFPDVKTINFGGGFKEARMPDEDAADLQHLGAYAKRKLIEFYERTNRKLMMEVEPGTFIMANAGYLITRVLDKKHTGANGFHFILLNGGMETNSRPLLYGSRHPFYVISKEGQLRSSEFDLSALDTEKDRRVIVGKCCESGDSQCLDETGNVTPRLLAEPQLDDFIVIGGTGAYCSSMTPFNYNSALQIAEVLLRENNAFLLIRKRQTLEQLVENELPLSNNV
ncbi:MAG: diaminopimelate decarboxylase [Actinobacteria bacterium]|nr:diaminopimelate decarboxylase [Actinomycetota bacterium]